MVTANAVKSGTPSFPAILAADEDARIIYIKRDRWISHPQADRAIRRMRLTVTGEPSLRPRCVLVWGPSNVGKTATYKAFAKPYAAAAHFDPEEGVFHPSILEVECPAEADEARLFDTLLEKLEPFTSSSRGLVGSSLRVVHREAYRALEDAAPMALSIDNLNNFAAFRGAGQTTTLNTLRRLSSVRRLPLIIMGTEAVHSILRTDKQFLERFSFIRLKGLSYDEFVIFSRRLLSTYPLRRSTAIDEEAMKFVFEASEGIIGRVVIHLREAAIFAIETGQEEITNSILRSDEVLEALEALKLVKVTSSRGHK
ncbi:TniB family NTP-binding protein [Caulobacter sp. ErkDOM-E]|uniref:TniB family NTP-binding protein n=1 Tax=Caulobacter sp. ErkDOM-E TaxID=3402778 RepID=UPI003AF63C48